MEEDLPQLDLAPRSRPRRSTGDGDLLVEPSDDGSNIEPVDEITTRCLNPDLQTIDAVERVLVEGGDTSVDPRDPSPLVAAICTADLEMEKKLPRGHRADSDYAESLIGPVSRPSTMRISFLSRSPALQYLRRLEPVRSRRVALHLLEHAPPGSVFPIVKVVAGLASERPVPGTMSEDPVDSEDQQK